MRNIPYNILGLLKCMILFVLTICISCNDEYTPSNDNTPSLSFHYLKPSSTSFEFGSKEAAKSLQITSEGVEWAIYNSASWLSVSPASGNTTTNVAISAEQHLSGDTSRVSIMNLVSTLPNWEYNRALSVSQSAATPYLTPSVRSHTFSGTANTKEIAISSNSVWKVVCNHDWLRAIKLSESALQISVDENPTNNFRSGTIIISNKSGEQKIDITQYASGVSVSQTSIQIEKDATLFTLNIESEIAWTATASADWIQITPIKSDAGTSNIEISTTENNTIDQRKGYVYIYTDAYQRAQIEIVQKGLYIKVPVVSMTFYSVAGSSQISIQSNTHWFIKELPEWLTSSVNQGEGTQTIDIITTENNSTMPRNGYIVIAHEFLNLSHKIPVTQEAKTFAIYNKNLEFGVKASSQPLNIISELPWQSITSDEWISTDIAQGNGNETVNVSVTETQSYEERFGTIDYRVVDKNICVNVHQLAKYFTITDNSFRFGSKGGVTNLTFSANEAWTIQVADSVEWVALSQTSGEGNGKVKIAVADNPSMKGRETTLSIKTSVGQTIDIVVKQDARYLRTDAKSFSYFAFGGENTFIIDTDGTYIVESSEEWITLQKQSSTTWKVCVTKNTEAIVRQGIVTIQLTDLAEGEEIISIPITQTYEGGIFIDRAFEEDVKWDVTTGDSLSINIQSFATDTCWNSTENIIVLSRDEYGEETIYDSLNGDSINLSKSEYQENTWYNSSLNDTIKVSKKDYQKDEVYDSFDNDTIRIDKEDYQNDEKYDLSENDNVNIKKSDYDNENEWN